jgi:transporter family protein
LLEQIHPNVLALSAAFVIAVARIFYQVALGSINPTAITTLVNSVSFLMAISLYSYDGGVEAWPIKGLLWFVTVGLSGSLFGRYMSFLSQRLVGVARTSVLMQSMLVWSTALAVIFLGERLSFGILAGSLLIMFGGVFLVLEKGEVSKKIPLRYYLVPLLTAFSFALTFLLRRYGLAWIPSSPLGMAVSNLTALVILGIAFPFTGDRKTRSEKKGDGEKNSERGYLFALLGGVFNAVAAIFFWTAVQNGEIVRVVPINGLSVLFVILFSWIFFRRQERITWQVAIGGVLSVAGAFILVA